MSTKKNSPATGTKKAQGKGNGTKAAAPAKKDQAKPHPDGSSTSEQTVVTILSLLQEHDDGIQNMIIKEVLKRVGITRNNRVTAANAERDNATAAFTGFIEVTK